MRLGRESALAQAIGTSDRRSARALYQLPATPFCGVPNCIILDPGRLGSKVRNMRMLIAVLAAGLTLTFAKFGLGTSEAVAASFCKHRYSLCLARCPGPFARCSSRCQVRYRSCIYPAPSIRDLL
jgi:hypothetical protein